MNLRTKLDYEFSSQSSDMITDTSDMKRYITMAEGYAEMENVIAVLSDLNRNESFVANGKFADILDIDAKKCNGKIPSIWEEAIFHAIHPDDLEMKMLQELLFYHHVNRLPVNRRFNQCMMQRLRMRSKTGHWIETLHRLRYIPSDDQKNIRFALCLYGAMVMEMKNNSIAMDTVTGQSVILDKSTGVKILSPQEITVIKLIENGNSSRDIADALGISLHTVSRHRQNIIAKLKVRNSAEACKTARNLSIL